MTYEEALQVIVDEEKEMDAICRLAVTLNRRYELSHNSALERKACLNAIKKINKGKKSAIDALCDEEGK